MLIKTAGACASVVFVWCALTECAPYFRIINCFSSAPLAQLVEQGTFNPKAAGSIPSRRTIETPSHRQVLRGGFFVAKKQPQILSKRLRERTCSKSRHLTTSCTRTPPVLQLHSVRRPRFGRTRHPARCMCFDRTWHPARRPRFGRIPHAARVPAASRAPHAARASPAPRAPHRPPAPRLHSARSPKANHSISTVMYAL